MSRIDITPAQVLGIREGATEEKIRLTFIKQVKQFHPDRFNDVSTKAWHEKKLNQIKSAYDALMFSHHCDLWDGEPMLDKQRLRKMAKATTHQELEPMSTILQRLKDELEYVHALDSIDVGDFEDAAKRLKGMSVLRKQNWKLQQKLAEAYLGLGSLIPAHSAANRALELGANTAQINHLLGKVEERDGNLRAARAHYVAAYKQNPNDPQIKASYNRGSLQATEIMNKAKKFGAVFLPKPDARTLRYYPGLLKVKHIRAIAYKLLPDSNARSFRYSGFY